MQLHNFLRILGTSLAVLCLTETATALKADGELCEYSAECATPCCSKKGNVNGTWVCNSAVYNSNEPSCEGIPYKEYELCDYSSDCEPKCCRIDDDTTKTVRLQKCQYYAKDTCLPDKVATVFPSILKEGDYCSTSSQCVDGCCKPNPDNGNKSACLKSSNSTGCIKTNQLFDDYEFCSQSFMCKNGCCSNTLSDDKKYKCWPNDGKSTCMTLPSANSNSTSNSRSMMPSSSTVLLSAAFCLSLHGACHLLARAGLLGSK